MTRVFYDSIPDIANPFYTNTAFLNLTSNVWTTGPSLTTARYYHTCSLVTLASGEKEIVVVGGQNDDQVQGSQMTVAKLLECMCLALQACWTMAPIRNAAKFDTFLSLDCARWGWGGGSNFAVC